MHEFSFQCFFLLTKTWKSGKPEEDKILSYLGNQTLLVSPPFQLWAENGTRFLSLVPKSRMKRGKNLFKITLESSTLSSNFLSLGLFFVLPEKKRVRLAHPDSEFRHFSLELVGGWGRKKEDIPYIDCAKLPISQPRWLWTLWHDVELGIYLGKIWLHKILLPANLLPFLWK